MRHDLRIPLEILEKILSLAFPPLLSHSLPDSSINNTPPPPPPPVHLLLVSHAIHNLCLPFLYRSLYLGRPSLWKYWFGANGVFGAGGEEARRKRGWVKEVWILEDWRSYFPLASEDVIRGRIKERGGASKMECRDWLDYDGPTELAWEELIDHDLLDEDETSAAFPNLLDIFYLFPSLSLNSRSPATQQLVENLQARGAWDRGLPVSVVDSQVFAARVETLLAAFFSPSLYSSSSSTLPEKRLHLSLIGSNILLFKDRSPSLLRAVLQSTQQGDHHLTFVLHHHHVPPAPPVPRSLFEWAYQKGQDIGSPNLRLDFSDQEGRVGASSLRVDVVKWWEQSEPNGRTGVEKDWKWIVEDDAVSVGTREVRFWDVLEE